MYTHKRAPARKILPDIESSSVCVDCHGEGREECAEWQIKYISEDAYYDCLIPSMRPTI